MVLECLSYPHIIIYLMYVNTIILLDDECTKCGQPVLWLGGYAARTEMSRWCCKSWQKLSRHHDTAGAATPWYCASLEALIWLANHHQSSQVFVHVRIVLVALQVVPCDEILNPLLDGFEVRLQHYTIPVRKWQKKNTNRYLVIYQNTTRRDPTFHSHDQVNN